MATSAPSSVCDAQHIENWADLTDSDDELLARAQEKADLMQGKWSKATIAGTKLTWNDGKTNDIEFLDSEAIKMVLRGREYTGELWNDGKLHWSDGDVWMKLESKVDSPGEVLAPASNRLRIESWADLSESDDEFSPRAHMRRGIALRA